MQVETNCICGHFSLLRLQLFNMLISIAQCSITQVKNFSDAVTVGEGGLLLSDKSIELPLVLLPNQVSSPLRCASRQAQPGIDTPLSMRPR
ncbi:hypothetical protein D3C84_1136500 [compost metagenome]